MPYDTATLAAALSPPVPQKTADQWERDLELSSNQVATLHRVLTHYRTAAERISEELYLSPSERRELLAGMVDGSENLVPAAYLHALVRETERSARAA